MRFVQIHFLTSYPAALLNRDDAGLAKRVPFGGATRTRVSSQSLKRHWRTHEGAHSLHMLGEGLSVRSRETFEREIVQRLVVDQGLDLEMVRGATRALLTGLLGESAKAKKTAEGEDAKAKKAGDGGEPVHTGQITVLGAPELSYLRGLVAEVAAGGSTPKMAEEAMLKKLKDKDLAKNLKAIKLGAGLDAALFGRMVTGDILARVDAAIHVAHAFTVHAEEAESDYFTAVDDLLQSGDEDGNSLGAGHVNATELTSGLYYGYVAVDFPLLISNLEGCARKKWQEADKTLASRVLAEFIHLVATVSPGAKLGSTAPHSYAQLILVELGDEQPRTLANAFLRPVRAQNDLLATTYRALSGHLADLDRMYGRTHERRLAAMGDDPSIGQLVETLGLEGTLSLPELAAWLTERVSGARHAVPAGAR